MILALKIDVTKIDKNRLFEGQKGKYLDAVVFVNGDCDQYGQNGMITQSVSKDERESGVKGEILGNCKIIKSSSTVNHSSQPQSQPTQEPAFDDDIPF